MIKCGQEETREERERERRASRRRWRGGPRWRRTGWARGSHDRGLVSFLWLGGTERSAAKKDRPGCVDAQNLQLYRKKGGECSGQTASWPVNNAAK